MGPTELRQKLVDGDNVIGSMVLEFGTSGLAQLAAAAGAEFLIYDMEHTGWSMESIRNQMAWSKSADLVRLVRVPAASYDFIARAMDVGAQGVMVPMVESADQARLIASSMTYPPAGRRGAAFGISHDDYSPGSVADKMSRANDSRICICQIETWAGVENVEAIAATPGVDVLWVGQFDLTLSMGIPAKFDHPRFAEALERVSAAARKEHKICGAMAQSAADAQQWIDCGFTMIAYWADLWIYQTALKSAIDQLKQ